MNIPLNIILDSLSGYNIVNHVEAPDRRSFPLVNLFPGRRRELPEGHLYIGRLSEILSADWRSPEICCIALRDRMQDELETPERLRNIIILNSNVDLFDLFTGVQREFFRVFDWVNSMNEYIISNRSIQDMLALSEGILGNFITISDSMLRLMAYTPNLDCDCPTSRFLVDNGYHSDEAMATFQRNKLPASWQTATDIMVKTDHIVSPYDYAHKVVRYNNSYFCHVVMICNNKAPTKGVLELFRLLLDHLMVVFERLWRDNSGFAHTYDGIIRNIIQDRELKPEIIRTRASYAGLPLEGRFRLFRVRPEGSVDTLMQRFSREIMDFDPEARVTLFDHGFLILSIGRGEDRGEAMREHLEPLLERYDARCGMSDEFEDICDLGTAYDQTEIALQYGGSRALMPYSGGAHCVSPRFFSYESYYPCHLLCSSPENVRMAQRTRAYRALRILEDYDQRHESSNLELLYFYLINDRRATETAQRLHMHRNNVIYRIGRIEELIGMSLDDSAVRLRLLLAYEMFTVTR